ncbi:MULTISPECIES: MarR family winged helix-turn-helix transcriptional regulator [Actinomadura]|uniref:MarR family winged helix-turn-helix transcriptional regulator n=1 Tax=Actinomadura yumaensis TaxID=111807 RepID=A0ABW2CM44_9ACTN|nr:MarR family transcriptional regulator [Actinomadura sp. J1-007]MWK36808.1 MarR family transcriptional regulator [Actinomadura sp. J1-007]
MTGRQAQEPAGSPADEGLADQAAAVEVAMASAVLAWSRAAEDAGVHISPVQLRAIEAVARHGRLNLGGLAAEMGVMPSSASRLCDRLESAGLVVRESAVGDRREIIVRLSGEGERLRARLTRWRRTAIERALGELSPATRSRLLDSLTEFGRACERQERPGPGDARSRTA